MLHAEELAKQKRESRLFFYHRQASDKHNLTIRRGRKAAIREARGPYKSAWSDIDRISELFEQPDADLAYLERVYTNRLIAGSDRAFDLIRWRELEGDADFSPGEQIVLGFDGSRFDDATALIGCNQAGLIKPIRIWERPLNLQMWEVPIAEVDERVSAIFETFEVVRMYCDPPMWESYVAKWAGRYGDKVVIEWWTNRPKPMAYACRGFAGAIIAGEISHTGDEQLTQHIGNARKRYTGHYDEQEKPLWYIQKERQDSPKKIDGAMGSILSWEAWRDAVSSGALGDVREPGDLGITVGSYG